MDWPQMAQRDGKDAAERIGPSGAQGVLDSSHTSKCGRQFRANAHRPSAAQSSFERLLTVACHATEEPPVVGQGTKKIFEAQR